jgi:hypothetical protein
MPYWPGWVPQGQAAVQFDIVSRYGGELIARGTLLKPTTDRCYSTVEVRFARQKFMAGAFSN